MKRIQIAETKNLVGKEVEIAGWVHVRRDHGKIIFIDLRDRSGLVQVVFGPWSKDLYEIGSQLRPEWVIRIKGKVNDRPDNMINPDMETGRVEIAPTEVEVLNKADILPFPIDTEGRDINEELRLKYRYLDLRRERLKNNIVIRHQVVKYIRDYLDKRGFLEIETPIFTKSTPEGARDYVVPSRIYPGKFYALPQSPQQYKQLLMIAGLEKYFQIARCFRDEDLRGDRQPEFTQLDLEMSFTDQEEILSLIEDLFTGLVKEILPKHYLTKTPWPRLTYAEAVEKYGTDKPDLRKNKNDPYELAFAFVVDFPMFEKNKEGKWDSAHHPFTMMKKEDLHYLDTGDLQKIKADSYDFVLNGFEIASGSIRINDPEIQTKVFSALGMNDKDINEKFGHMIEAFKYGAPPHGGIAPGIDRFVMIACGEPNIREVTAFPKTGDGRDPMMNSPSELNKEQLKELHLKTDK